MGSVLWGPSSGSPTPREEGVVWSHAPPWKPGSLSKAVTPPQDPKPLRTQPSSPWSPAEARSSVGVLDWPVTHTLGHGQEAMDAEQRVPVGVRVACVPLCRRITSCEIRMMT